MSSNTSCGGQGCASCACSADQTPALEATGIGASYRFAVRGLTREEWGIVPPMQWSVQVDHIVADSPAHNVLLVGDSIIKIDGTPLSVSGDETLFQVIELVMGAENTPVTLTIQRIENGKLVEREFAIMRGAVAMPDAAEVEELDPKTAKQLGVRPPCGICPFKKTRSTRCPTCPNPYHEACALIAAKDKWIEQILERSKPVEADPRDVKAIAYVEARLAYRSARKAVDDAQNKLELIKAWFTLTIAKLGLRNATPRQLVKI